MRCMTRFHKVLQVQRRKVLQFSVYKVLQVQKKDLGASILCVQSLRIKKSYFHGPPTNTCISLHPLLRRRIVLFFVSHVGSAFGRAGRKGSGHPGERTAALPMVSAGLHAVLSRSRQILPILEIFEWKMRVTKVTFGGTKGSSQKLNIEVERAPAYKLSWSLNVYHGGP